MLPRQSLRGALDERPRFNDVTNPLPPGTRSTAELILEKYDAMRASG